MPDTLTPDTLSRLTLAELARRIREDWRNPYFGAVPYLRALYALDDVRDTYGADSASTIVAYFLANSAGWRGPVARAIKAELRRRIGRPV